jgi:hypothetical protein
MEKWKIFKKPGKQNWIEHELTGEAPPLFKVPESPFHAEAVHFRSDRIQK